MCTAYRPDRITAALRSGNETRKKNQMGAVGIVVVFFLILILSLVFGSANAYQEKERQRHAIEARIEQRRLTKLDYEFLLNGLELHPNNPQIRRRCLEVGREYARMCREGGLETTFDELAIKNDIDAACAASASMTSGNAAGDYELILPSETAASSQQPAVKTKRKTSVTTWGCLCLIIAPCIIGALFTPPEPSTKKRDQVSSPMAKQKRKSEKPNQSKRPVTAEAVPEAYATVKEVKKRKPLTWGSLFSGIEELGFRPSVEWKKSKVEEGWIGIYHLRNVDATDYVLNEVSLQFVGETGRKISKVDIQAEIYDRQHKVATMKNGIACLNLLEAPKEVVEAFRSEKSTKIGRWKITRRSHLKNGGYDIECTRTYGTTSKAVNSKPNVKPPVKAAPKQANFVERYSKRLDEVGLGGDELITRLSSKGTDLTITVTDVWSGFDYSIRFETATALYEAWARIASPKSPDSARITIKTQGGTEIGGSRVWAGSLIWVQK